jgi:GntR family transcriptional regulator/MocR family aminotransferase
LRYDSYRYKKILQKNALRVRTKMASQSEHIMWRQLFRLEPGCGQSLQHQIRETLVAAILDARVSTDTPLPSSRQLARELGVARNTVMLAYQRLVDEGFLVARERSGYYVNPEMIGPRSPAAAPTPGPRRRNTGWVRRFRVRPSLQRNIVKGSNWREFDYPFIYGQLDPAHFPINDWRECYRQALSVQAISALVRDQLDADDPLLVEQIQTRVLPRRGVWADRDQILITLGAQSALYLLAALLIGDGDTVGIEEPGYPDARNIFSLHTPRLRALPLDQHGLIVDQRLQGSDYVFVTPSHQSPTTVTLPLERREALLRRAAEDDFIVIEDDYESEINFLGNATPALKSLDREDRVLYVGSLSKTLDPGLRIGYLVGPAELIREARALRRLMLRHPPTNNQRAVALFLALGHHDSLIQRLGHIYRERWETLGAALARYLPDSARTPSSGGTAFWVQGPAGLDARELARRAAERGIFIEPGDVNFMIEPHPRNYFRLGFGAIANERIEPGVRELSRLVADLD